MKILVTGSNGQVGSAVIEQYAKNERHEVLGLSREKLDISSRNDVMVAVSSFQPDAVVNAAAMTNVDACETQIEKAFEINSLGVRNLAQASDSVGAQLIHLSTDFVFDGKQNRPYSEFDLTNPLSIYAKSKLGGDQEALSYSLGTVLRVAWVFGNENGDFFSWVAKGVAENSVSSLIDDQVGTPTYSFDVAKVVEYCSSHKLTGLINVANSGETTRLEMGKAICDRLNISNQLTGISNDSLGRPAPRPAYSALNSSLLTKITGIQMRSWQEALDEYVSRMDD